MTTYIVLRVDDDDQADDILRDMREYPMHDLLTPCLENRVQARLVMATRDGRAHTPAETPADFTDEELQALERDLQALEVADPRVRAAAQSLDAVIEQLNRRAKRSFW